MYQNIGIFRTSKKIQENINFDFKDISRTNNSNYNSRSEKEKNEDAESHENVLGITLFTNSSLYSTTSDIDLLITFH